MVKLNLGCGLQCPDGWINIDSSWGVKLSKRPFLKKILYTLIPASWGVLPNAEWPANTRWMNITRRFVFADASVDVIYSSHTLEHLTYEEARFVLQECNRVLKPGGIIRIVVPDFEQLVNSYLNNKEQQPAIAAKKFLSDSLYFEIPIPGSLAGMIKFYFTRKNNHHFLYDEAGLQYQLENAGFHDIRRMTYGDSRIPGIAAIDIAERFRGAVCLEAQK